MNIETPSGWSVVTSRESNISEFVTGVICDRDTENFEQGDTYLVWTEKEFDTEALENSDVEEYELDSDGTLPLKSNRSNEVQDSDKFLVEFNNGGHLVKEEFFETESKAEEFIQQELPDPDLTQ